MKSTAGRWIVWSIALLVSFGGAWVSWDLSVNHNRLPGQKKAETKPAATSLLGQVCEQFTWADCDETAESRWANFPFWSRRPWMRTASLGLAFFVGMACWLLIVGWPSFGRSWVQTIPLVATGFGLGMCIVLEIVMWTQLSKPCPLCMISHAAALLLFLLLVLLWPRAARDEKVEAVPSDAADGSATLAYAGSTAIAPPTKRPWPTGWVLMAALILSPTVSTLAVTLAEGLSAARMAAANFMRGRGGTSTQPAIYTADDMRAAQQHYMKQLARYEARPQHAYLAWQLAPKMDIPIEGRPAMGPANARHTVVIFSDFQCPHCKEYEDHFQRRIMPMFAAPEAGGVRVVFKHWPICSTCNPYASPNLHPSACAGAIAAEAAYALGGDTAFWKMHDLLFAKQADWVGSEDFDDLAQAAGLDLKTFNAAMQSPEVKARVRQDIDDGVNMGQALLAKGEITQDENDLQVVRSTPTVYVDGKRLQSPNFPDPWRQILTASAAETQATDQTARIARLENQLVKTLADVAEAKKRFRYYQRPEHGILGWQLAQPVQISAQNRPSRGPESAAHTVVLFGDLDDNTAWMFDLWFSTAIFPRAADPAVGGVRYVYKHWPMDSGINPHVKGDARPIAGQTALALEAAFMLGGNDAFWKLHDLLIIAQRQKQPIKDFGPVARQLGLEEQKFLATMNGPEAKAHVTADIEEGANLGKDLVAQGQLKENQREWIAVDSVPSIFVDGKRLYVYEQMAVWNQVLGLSSRPRQGGATTVPAK